MMSRWKWPSSNSHSAIAMSSSRHGELGGTTRRRHHAAGKTVSGAPGRRNQTTKSCKPSWGHWRHRAPRLWLMLIATMLTLASSATTVTTSSLARCGTATSPRQSGTRRNLTRLGCSEPEARYHSHEAAHFAHDRRLRHPPCDHCALPGRPSRAVAATSSNTSGEAGPARPRRPTATDRGHTLVLLFAFLLFPPPSLCTSSSL